MTSRVSIAFSKKATALFLFGSAGFTYALFLARFGYRFGNSDQDEVLPYLYSKLDPSLFTQDWFVQMQQAHFNVRTWTTWMLEGMHFFGSTTGVVLFAYLFTWFGIAWGLYRVARALVPDSEATACLTIPLTLVFTPFWTLGGNDLVHSMLVPSMLAWLPGLHALAFLFRKKIVPAAFLAGIASLFQALVGLQIALVSGLLLCYWFGKAFQDKTANRSHTLKAIIVYSFTFILASAPSLGPLFYQQFTASTALEISDEPSLFYIMGAFRNPHHYLFFSFSYSKFTLLLASSVVACLLLRRWKVALSRDLFVLAGILMVLCLFALCFTEIWPILAIGKLQLFKLTVILKILLLIPIARVLACRGQALAMQFIDRKNLLQYSIALFALGLIALAGSYSYAQSRNKIYPADTPRAQIELENWIRDNTTANSLFAIPPGVSWFRSRTKRSIVINHKAFPYRDADIYTWFERLQQWAPIELPDRTDRSLISRLDSSYHALEPKTLESLVVQYGATHLLRNTPLPAVSPVFIEVFQNSDWYLYACMPEARE